MILWCAHDSTTCLVRSVGDCHAHLCWTIPISTGSRSRIQHGITKAKLEQPCLASNELRPSFAVVTWLRKTGNVDRLHDLKDDQIQVAIASLPYIMMSSREEPRMRTNIAFGSPQCVFRRCDSHAFLLGPSNCLQSPQFEAMGSKHASHPYADPHTLEAYRTVA